MKAKQGSDRPPLFFHLSLPPIFQSLLLVTIAISSPFLFFIKFPSFILYFFLSLFSSFSFVLLLHCMQIPSNAALISFLILLTLGDVF